VARTRSGGNLFEFGLPREAVLIEAQPWRDFAYGSKVVKDCRAHIKRCPGEIEQGQKATGEIKPLTTKRRRYVQDRSARTNLS
jgi:hypothetical protein